VPDGSGEVPTIQAAVQAAADGDTILLANGVFQGDGNRDIDLGERELVIRSETNDPSSCVIDCGATQSDPHRGFLIRSGQGPGTAIKWIKITNAYAELGGGILCEGSSPTLLGLTFFQNEAREGGAVACERAAPVIDGCIFDSNFASENGGGLLCGTRFGDNKAAQIRSCVFVGNIALGRGGGISCSYSRPEISRCGFTENTGAQGGAIACYLATPTVQECFFRSNCAGRGGGIWCGESASPAIASCTFYENAGYARGAGVYSQDSAPAIRNTIIAWSVQGEAVYSRQGAFHPELSCCDLYRNRGGDWTGLIAGQLPERGNLASDPIFCNRFQGVFSIASYSPCAARQSGACGLIGAYDVTCDVVPAQRMSWGRLRGLFR